MPLYLPGPAPMSPREKSLRVLSFTLRCASSAIAGIGAAAVILTFASAVTVLGDVVVTAALP